MTGGIRRAAVINDLSGVGRCSLSVMLPVMSALGVQVCPAVTGLLSAHTAFEDVVALDTTDFLERELAAWGKMGLSFDAVCSGYLANVRQGNIVCAFFNAHAEALKLVDPAMADSGRLYSGLSGETVGMMRELCSMADVSTPNLSEYALITGEEYSLSPRQDDEIEEMLLKFPGKAVVIKGVPVKGGFVNACRDFSGRVSILPIDMLKQNYPGTGDIFAAVLFSELMNGRALDKSVERASDFVRSAMEMSMRSGGDVRHGVKIEAALGLLTEDK